MPVIEVTNLHKRYPGKIAVHDVSFSVDEGEIFGILGPNGAGKTTTVESVIGLRKPDGGTISVLGMDPVRDRDQVRTRVGVQLQQSELPERMRVREALALYSSFYPDPLDWRELADQLGIADKLGTEFRKLSGGQKQRLSIALALVGNPEVAVLDELTTGLDPQARRDTWEVVQRVRDRGVTVLLVTHFMEEAEFLCDRLSLIDDGRVVATDSPTGLIARVDSGTRLRFRVTGPFDTAVLTALPGVTEVRRTGPQVQVSGTGELLSHVTAALAAAGITPADMRTEHTTLDDAFLALTGRQLAS
ncbi:ABC transporter ATP-binding protein [Allokutzneria sp. NRRL B-24872]|uniref:ABC transporter ATP-binding protein n=1 Tax=Allokutzneria sp. NRRL B-24872 TaxID=1137961 RepID=UPI000A36DB3E|nr:ABC transporter ATP-binding protein [Allokutzneria sp. NRRL B-24872]